MENRERSFGKHLHIHHIRTEHPEELHFVMHAHRRFELFYFAAGKASFWVEGCEYVLTPGDLMLFDVSEAHHIVVEPGEPYERIVVSFTRELMETLPQGERLLAPFTGHSPGHGNRLPASAFADDFWRQCLYRMTEPTEELQVVANLIPLCNEIARAYGRAQTESLSGRTLPRQVITYINDHLDTLADVEEITEALHLSRSALYTLFRRITGTSVWEYVTVKRLHRARSLLTEGVPPSQVYLRCGFRDYTTFFRAYKRYFGTAPSKKTGTG